MGLGGSLAAIEFAFADFLGKGFVVEAPGHELAFGVEVGDLAAEEAAGPEEGDVRLAPGESAVPVALMQVAHGSDVPLAARRQHRAAGAAVGAGGGLGAAVKGAALGALGALVAAVAPPPGPAPRAGGLRAVHLALGDTGRSVTVIALAAVTARFAPASTALATAALVAAAFACTALIAIAVVAALAAQVAVARTLALPAAFEARAAAFEARAVRTADLAATSKGERVGSGHAGRRRRYFFPNGFDKDLDRDTPWAAAGGGAHARGSDALDGARQTPGEAALWVLLVPDADVGDDAEARRDVAAGASVVVGDGLAQLSDPDI